MTGRGTVTRGMAPKSWGRVGCRLDVGRKLTEDGWGRGGGWWKIFRKNRVELQRSREIGEDLLDLPSCAMFHTTEWTARRARERKGRGRGGQEDARVIWNFISVNI